jgi:hypothetical protein
MMFENVNLSQSRSGGVSAGGSILIQNDVDIDPTLVWTFTTTYDNGTHSMFWGIAKKTSAESLTVTWQWTDGDGEHTVVEDSYAESTINTELSFALPFEDVVVTMTFSDKNAVRNISTGGDPGDEGVQMKVAPDNIGGLLGTTFIRFETQSLFEPLILTGLNTDDFRWRTDGGVQEVDLDGVYMDAFDMIGCSALSNLTNVSTITVANEADISFKDCALSEESVNALLISLDASGAIDGYLDISGGTNATFNGPAAGDAYDRLINNKGWIITDND